jgi:hypothetical protein
MSREISQEEFKRRQMVAQAKSIMTEAMGNVTDTVGELYCSEWLSILGDLQLVIVKELLLEDWRPRLNR